MTRAAARRKTPELRLIRSPGTPAPLDGRSEGVSRGRSEGVSRVREEKVALARRRMAEGYYDRIDVLERVAEGILKQLRPAAPNRAG